MTMFTRRCSRQLRKWRSEFASGFKIFLSLILMSSFTTLVFGQEGTAPVNPPVGGLRVDGFLGRQGAAGDWFAGPGGSGAGTFLFNPDGTSPYPSLLNQTLFWKLDPYTLGGTTIGGTEDRFTQGSQLNDDPNTWGWDTHSPQSKDDINNAFFFIVQNPSDGHWWALMAGDREVTNGTSYLDFEFLQAPITKVAGGTFHSDGPDQGRTVGDIDVTLSFTGGGSTFSANIFQWSPVGDGSFFYSQITPTVGSVFVQHNPTNGTPFPGNSGAYGQNNYPDSLQFVEGAIDITALLGPGISTPCRGLPFTSIFIKTKSSAATTAELKDLIAPFALNICTEHVPPTFTGTINNTVALGCNPAATAITAALDGATATDNCSATTDITITSSDGAVLGSCSKSQTRTFTATDACGNTATASRTVTWTSDTQAPGFTGSYANVTLGCNPAASAITGALDGATATDNCTATVTITSSDGAITGTCSKTQTRTFTATDGCGNTATTSRTVIWTSDTQAPGFTGSYANVTLGCNPAASAITGALDGATATDNCTATVTITSSDGAVTGTCSKTQTRTFTATDGCGNTATISRTVIWTSDTQAPGFTGDYSTVGLGCNPAASAISGALDGATATDNCTATVTITSSDGAVTGDCSKSQTRTFTATDGCGNTATISRTVTWSSDASGTPPVFTGTINNTVTLGCNPAATAITAALDGATATDNCTAIVTITSSDGAVTGTCSKTQTRTFTATDGCGNTATAFRTVVWTSDTQAPGFTGDYTTVTLGCNPAASAIGAALDGATATDNCTATVTITSSDGGITGTCSKTQTRTFTATDGCGNTATASRTVIWTSDTQAPGFTGTVNNTVALGCNPAASDITGALDGATATDNCTATVTITSSDGAVTGTCSKTQTRTFTATDGCGNTATASRTVTWTSDTQAPGFTSSFGTVTLGCNPAASDITGALDGATATDNCTATVTITSSDGGVTGTCSKTQTRTFTATDGCGNTATASRTVIWTSDTQAPGFTGTVNNTVALGCNPAASDITGALDGATATDNCTATVTITSSDGAVTGTCSKTQTRTFTATDGCGNTATASRTVTWTSDTQAPGFTSSFGTVTLGCNPAATAITAALDGATATDNCTATVTISSSDGAITGTCSKTQTRTFTATDGCGNTATASRTVIWTSDTQAPGFTGTINNTVTLGCNPAASAITAALDGATATDNCTANVTITSSDGAVTGTCTKTQTRTFTATDGCGNTATASRTVTWKSDTQAPGFTGVGATVELDCGASTSAINAAFSSPTPTDNCPSPSITSSDNDQTADCSTGFSRIVTRTWIATDGCGNTASASQIVKVKCCPAVLCTYTQGYYGNPGGISCSGTPTNNSFTTAGLIAHSLANLGGTLTVGCTGINGHSVTINNNATDIACVIEVLPGGGASGALPLGNNSICNLPASLLKNDRINNALLAQTITLALNMGINPPSLGSFALQANKWLVTADVVACGSTTIKSCTFNCIPDPVNIGQFIWTVNTSPYHVSSCRISQAVYDALTTKNVAGLLALANSALCGNALPAGVSYSDITAAVDCINETFDGCKSFVTWVSGDVAPTANSFCSLPSSSTPCPPVTLARPVSESFASTDNLKVTAYPNPFKATVRFTIESTVSGQAQLQVYNTLGQRISTVYNGYLQANRSQVVEYKAPRLGSNLIYILRVGGKQVTGKLLRIE